MSSAEELRKASDDFMAGITQFSDAVIYLFPKLCFALTIHKVISEKRPLSEFAETLKMFDFIDPASLEQKVENLKLLSLEFKKTSQEFFEIAARHPPYFPGKN